MEEIGISEDENFETCGVYDINDLQKQISTLCADSMEPVLRIDILPMKFEGKDILAVKMSKTSGQLTTSGAVSGAVGGAVSSQVEEKNYNKVLEYQKLILEFCVNPKSNEITKYLKIQSKTYVREKIIKPLIKKDY